MAHRRRCKSRSVIILGVEVGLPTRREGGDGGVEGVGGEEEGEGLDSRMGLISCIKSHMDSLGRRLA